MSTAVMTAVFKHSASKGGSRLVLLALADEASDEGMVTAYRRSQSHLAKKGNMDSGTVARSIKALVEMGELEVLRQGSGRASTDYRIVLPGIQIEGVQDAHPAPAPRLPRGREMPTQGVQDAAPIIPFSPGDNPVPPKNTYDPLWNDFWTAYPRHEEKAKAKAEWPAALKKAPASTIITAAKRYRDDPNREDQFTPYPAKWLKGERWNDDPLPPRFGKAKPRTADRAMTEDPHYWDDPPGSEQS